MFKKRAKKVKPGGKTRFKDTEEESIDNAVLRERKLPRNKPKKYTLTDLQQMYNLQGLSEEPRLIGTEDIYHEPEPEQSQATVDEGCANMELDEDVGIDDRWEQHQLAKAGQRVKQNGPTVTIGSLETVCSRLNRRLAELQRRRDELQSYINQIDESL